MRVCVQEVARTAAGARVDSDVHALGFIDIHDSTRTVMGKLMSSCVCDVIDVTLTPRLLKLNSIVGEPLPDTHSA